MAAGDRVTGELGIRQTLECRIVIGCGLIVECYFLLGAGQFCEVSLTDFFPRNGVSLAGIEVRDALPDLFIPSGENSFVHFAAEIRD